MVSVLTRVPSVITVPVGERSLAVVSRMRQPGHPHTLLAGSVSRSTCAFSASCKSNGCQAPSNHDNETRDCSDLNLRGVVDALRLPLDKTLVIGCSSQAIGFYDEVDHALITPRRGGFNETIPDFSAFFASRREGIAVITHMADCGFLAVELPNAYGFIHLTRLNMSAMDALKLALEHYGCELRDARLRLVAAVSGPNFPQRGDPEERFPGWAEAGFIRWISDDVWEPDNRGMMCKQIFDAGVSPDQLDLRDIIDPGDLSLGHASHSAGRRGLITLGRDAYTIMPSSLARSLSLHI